MTEPFDNRSGLIWMNGELGPWRSARVHVLSHSLHYGSAVFEGIRVYGGVPFRLEEHIERLRKSAQLIGYELPFSSSELQIATKRVIEAEQVSDGYVRPIAWRGAEVMGVASRGVSVQVAIAAWPWPNVFGDSAREIGISLQLSSLARSSLNARLAHAKVAANYVVSTLARDLAAAEGFDDALLLDEHGNAAEASGANLFVVRGGRLFTPPPASFLDGITRRVVLGLARELSIPVAEVPLPLQAVFDADEVFLTGTAYEVQPVRRIQAVDFEIGPVTLRLQTAYAELVRRGTPSTTGVSS